MTSGDAERFRECQAWARGLNLRARMDDLEGSSLEDSERDVGDAQPEASQVQHEHPEVGDTEPDVGDTQREASQVELEHPEVGEAQLGASQVEPEHPELEPPEPEVSEIQPGGTKQHEDNGPGEMFIIEHCLEASGSPASEPRGSFTPYVRRFGDAGGISRTDAILGSPPGHTK